VSRGISRSSKNNNTQQVLERFLSVERHPMIKSIIRKYPHLRRSSLKTLLDVGIDNMGGASTPDGRSSLRSPTIGKGGVGSAPSSPVWGADTKRPTAGKKKDGEVYLHPNADPAFQALELARNRYKDTLHTREWDKDEAKTGLVGVDGNFDKSTGQTLSQTVVDLAYENRTFFQGNELPDDVDPELQSAGAVVDSLKGEQCEWDVSPYLVDALHASDSLTLPMDTKRVLFASNLYETTNTASPQIHSHNLQSDGFVDELLEQVDSTPLERVKFEVVQYKTCETKPEPYQMVMRCDDVIPDMRPKPAVCPCSAVVLKRFRPQDNDEDDEAKKLLERRMAVVAIDLDGTQRMSLWDRRNRVIKQTAEASRSFVASDERDISTTPRNHARMDQMSTPSLGAPSESHSPRRKGSHFLTATSMRNSSIAPSGDVDAHRSADMILNAIVDSLKQAQSKPTDPHSPPSASQNLLSTLSGLMPGGSGRPSSGDGSSSGVGGRGRITIQTASSFTDANSASTGSSGEALVPGQPPNQQVAPSPQQPGSPYGQPYPYGPPSPYGPPPPQAYGAPPPQAYGTPPPQGYGPPSPYMHPQYPPPSPYGHMYAGGPPPMGYPPPPQGGQTTGPDRLSSYISDVSMHSDSGSVTDFNPRLSKVEEDNGGEEEWDIKDLFTKCRNNRYKQVEEYFATGCPVDVVDEHGNQAIHIAAQNGNKRMTKTCLRWGADINAVNNQGQTPLHYVFSYNYTSLGEYLLSKGANDTVRNHFGYTCYDGLRPEDKDEAIRLLRENLGNDCDWEAELW